MITIDIKSFDHHYACFYKWCMDNKLVGRIEPFPSSAKPILSKFKARLIFEETNLWVTDIAFETEEDLSFFKLKFN